MKTTTPANPALIYGVPVLFVLLWAAGFSVAKVGLQHAEPLTLLVWRYFLVLLLLSPFYLFLKPALPQRLMDWVHIAIVGILVQAVYFGMCWFAFTHGVSAGVLAIIMSLQPILVAILAPLIASEQVSGLRWTGLLLGLIGVIIVITARSNLEPPTAIGMSLSLLSLSGMTAAVLYEKRFGKEHHPVTSNLVQYFAGLIVVFPIALRFETMQVNWNPELIAALAYLVIGTSILAITLLLAMIRVGEVARVSALMFLVPPFAAVFGWLLLNEEMPMFAWLGMAVAAFGVIIATRTNTNQ